MTDPTMSDVKVPGTEWMSDYDTGKSSFVAPPQAKAPNEKGRVFFVQFLAQAPSLDKIRTKDANGRPLTTADGYVKAVVEGVKLVESGYELGETHIGTARYKKYDRKTNQPIPGEFRNASPALDYFHAFGIDLQPATAEEYAQYFEATADRQAQVTIDWSAYDSEAKAEVVKGWDNFPSVDLNDSEQVAAFGRLYPGVDPTGKKMPFVEKNGKRFWARAQVKRWISTIPEKKE